MEYSKIFNVTPIVEWNGIAFLECDNLEGWKELALMHPDTMSLLYCKEEGRALLCGKYNRIYQIFLEEMLNESERPEKFNNLYISSHMSEYEVHKLAVKLFSVRVDENFGFARS